MKTVLAIWNSGNKGKTETLREFAVLLLAAYPNYKEILPVSSKISATGDFRLVVEINGKIIGVESQGDPKTNLKSKLIDLADNFKCDIILCSTRTRGETVQAVYESLLNSRGFKAIWTSTYQVENTLDYKTVNQLKAKHLLELLQALLLI